MTFPDAKPPGVRYPPRTVTGPTPYDEFPGLSGYYLEDGCVLAIHLSGAKASPSTSRSFSGATTRSTPPPKIRRAALLSPRPTLVWSPEGGSLRRGPSVIATDG